MENIVENNKLIAEFMGFEFIEQHSRYMVTSKDFLDDEIAKGYRFDKDWNWLMPVVEKIESLNLGDKTLKTIFDEEDLYTNSNTSFLITYKECYVNFYGEMKVYENWIRVTECNSKIEAVYTAVVEFIKWYNLKKK